MSKVSTITENTRSNLRKAVDLLSPEDLRAMLRESLRLASPYEMNAMAEATSFASYENLVFELDL